MRIFLGASHPRRLELCTYRDELEREGKEVIARWLNDEQLNIVDAFVLSAAYSVLDLEDVRDCDVCVIFTLDRGTDTGGHFIELGFALALGKRCLVIGPIENIHCCNSKLEHYETWAEAKRAIASPVLYAYKRRHR